MQIFKYLSVAAAEASLTASNCITLRFNLPSNYNDPYELFLEPDDPLETIEERSFYEFFIRSMPEAPVTCFSRRPESVVMWAHYCQMAQGICLSINEGKLLEQIAGGYIHDVEYHKLPPKIPKYAIQYALTTGKSRHAIRMLAIANRAAYFQKRIDWQYEQERRLVVTTDAVQESNGMLLATFRSDCVDHVILGPFAGDQLKTAVESWATSSRVPIVKMRYSRRIHEPYFVLNGRTLVWLDGAFAETVHACPLCFDPTQAQVDSCEWCKITDADKRDAGSSNSLSAFLQTGVMESLPLVFDGIKPTGATAKPKAV